MAHGDARYAEADYDAAVKDYPARRVDPEDRAARFGRGLPYRKRDDSDKAIADCTDALRIDQRQGSMS